MKKILFLVASLFASTTLWAQSYTGDTARDAKIKAESQKMNNGEMVVIDDQTLFELSDGDFEIETKGYWPKNQLTDYLVQPKFGEKLETSTYATTTMELTWFYAILNCELADYEKYVEELRAFGWNIDANLQKGDVCVFDAQNKAGVKMHFTYRKSERGFRLEIDSRKE